jgi:hypothetical protein
MPCWKALSSQGLNRLKSSWLSDITAVAKVPGRPESTVLTASVTLTCEGQELAVMHGGLTQTGLICNICGAAMPTLHRLNGL